MVCNGGELFHLTWEVQGLEVQGSFGLTYIVGIIPPNLRSQETDKGMPHARAPSPPPVGPGWAWRGRQAASGRGVVVLIFSTH
jgi:hypothetical protein